MNVINGCDNCLQAPQSESAAAKAAKIAASVVDIDIKKEAQAGKVNIVIYKSIQGAQTLSTNVPYIWCPIR